jgi:glycerate-2-kinase
MTIAVTQPRVRALLRGLLGAALAAADPALALRRSVTRRGHWLHVGRTRYDLRRYQRVVAVGAGKASAHMAVALEHVLGSRLEGGLVVVKYGHAAPTRRVAILEAGHPVPDRAGRQAARRVLAYVRGLSSDDLVLVLLSGGASSLLPAPAPGLTLADKQRVTALLLRSGATIQEINAVRKHLSAIKGGRLAAATKARVVSLILSDVLGDDLGAIASGPTAPDPTTYADAIAVCRRHGIWSSLPSAVRHCLLAGQRGLRPESPKPGSSVFRRVQNQVIGNNRAAIAALAREARRRGFQPRILTAVLTGEAREAGRRFGTMARRLAENRKPTRVCLIAGGELTVSVRGNGKGGRAQEFALAAAGEIAGMKRVWIAGFGTDGTDGPTDAAGAVVTGQTYGAAVRKGLNPVDALRRNDSYTFFKQSGGLITTGATGTNVNDLYLLLVT